MPTRRAGTGTARSPAPGGEAQPLPATVLPERGRITAQGVIDRVTMTPASSPPSFSAHARIDRADGNAADQGVRIVWTGQRHVPGVQAGVLLRFEGMLSRVAGTPTVHNPRYEIIGRPEEP